MPRRTGTIAPEWFEQLYQGDADPWRFQTSDYERDKYQRTLQALSRPRYRHVLEVGCSIGVFTQMLAPRCDRLLAIDPSATALEVARRTCAHLPQVAFEERTVPEGFPGGPFDLIVFSEVLYYLDAADLEQTARRSAASLAPDGEVILCHWLGDTDYPLTGDEASEGYIRAMVTRLPAHTVLHHQTFRLDRLSSPPSTPSDA